MATGGAGSGYAVVVLLVIPVVGFVLFVLLHLRPLKETELESLAAKRRTRKIAAYFAFSNSQFSPNLNFKRRMASGGQFYNIREDLSNFPALAASLLKYKKHEWMIVGMERNREITLVWLNKGVDGTRVCLRLPFEQVAGIAQANGYTSVLVFHNHPNSDPSIYSCSQPSQTDLDASALRAKILNHGGINLLEFVCERGAPFRYRFSVADKFFPLSGFIEALRSENGISKNRNLSLHMERIF
jgi:hypothetical protein